MGKKKSVDLEAKLFDPKKRGCMAVLVGPRKVGEIDYEVHHDGNRRMKIGLRGARVPETAARVEIFVNGAAAAALSAEGGRGYVRLDSARGDQVLEVELGDTAEARVGGAVIGEGTFRRD
ncbi:MAG: hypothetical protein V2I67_03500 [Thermoanaerobaculales bacterium]|jgi:hypothetical protein|nr:hypothetical protein [Thermoanaerobaculales bacterium]